MKNSIILVLGATSDIGINIAKKFAQKGFDIQLAGRNSHNLKDECNNIRLTVSWVLTVLGLQQLFFNK